MPVLLWARVSAGRARPSGYGILLDLGSDSELVLESWALEDVDRVASELDGGAMP